MKKLSLLLLLNQGEALKLSEEPANPAKSQKIKE
jgi:hypothetical protein